MKNYIYHNYFDDFKNFGKIFQIYNYRNGHNSSLGGLTEKANFIWGDYYYEKKNCIVNIVLIL